MTSNWLAGATAAILLLARVTHVASGQYDTNELSAVAEQSADQSLPSVSAADSPREEASRRANAEPPGKPFLAASLESAELDAAESAAAPLASPKPKKPAPTPYKGVYYNNDFSYLDDPNYNGDPRLGEALKRVECGDCWTWDFGGEYRLRQHNENNFARSQLLGLNDDNNFVLQRTRLFASGNYAGLVRFYGEAIDATSSWEDFAPRTIEENRFDALNLFVDGLLWENDCGKMTGRIGRQELLYGAERLISPLDWANTRRTFDGAKLFWKGESWDLDGFWTRPVPFAQHVDNDHNFDHPDQSQEFLGLYSTYHGRKDRTFDFYYIRYAEYDGSPVNFDLSTFGSRWQGKLDAWLWEIEGGGQFGAFGSLTQSAGFYTLGIGYQLADCGWKPTLWTYYDWASGDRDPTDGRHETFNQLFPLGHKYFGYMDLVARQNIEDLNFLLTAKPSPKWDLLVWWHIFHLAEARDALYNAAGAAIRQDASGAAGTDVGQELDLTLTWLVRPNMDILFGYSHFYAGDFIAATGPGNDADFYYTRLAVRF